VPRNTAKVIELSVLSVGKLHRYALNCSVACFGSPGEWMATTGCLSAKCLQTAAAATCHAQSLMLGLLVGRPSCVGRNAHTQVGSCGACAAA